MARDLVILRGGDRLRWGGDLRRRYLFGAIEARTGGAVVGGWARADVRAVLAPYRRRRWEAWRRGPSVITTELLEAGMLDLVRRVGRPLAVDIHDEPVLQARALGVQLAAEQEAELQGRLDANVAAFRWSIVQSETFRRMAGIDASRAIVAANGTDTRHIGVLPPPARPTVAFSSGASAGRGIETLIDAARLARVEVPRLVLQLWLVAVSEDGARYRDDLRRRHAQDPWIEIAEVAYDDLPGALGRATVHCVPNPPLPYWDAVLPIKLFDSLASGRPVVVTPRAEMRAVVEATEAGLVARGDAPEDLAAALVEVLADPVGARRMGENARRAAETVYDWRVIGERLADDLLGAR
jgi:glycosyltransferase involved in cell wall biosynthesis